MLTACAFSRWILSCTARSIPLRLRVSSSVQRFSRVSSHSSAKPSRLRFPYKIKSDQNHENMHARSGNAG